MHKRTANLISKNGAHLPYNPALKARARDLRKNMTEAEKKLWQYLRTRKEIWHRQKPLDHFISDFYCQALRLVIEVDGGGHFASDTQKYDAARTQVLNGYDLKILRFTNDEVLKSFLDVCERVEMYCR
ncbi:MAG: endonuclease domain-containing protein [Rhizobacter sp.]|nr:endonuclease domain-containing protein [Chlorobiales bacterium]